MGIFFSLFIISNIKISIIKLSSVMRKIRRSVDKIGTFEIHKVFLYAYIHTHTLLFPSFPSCFNAFPRTVHRWTRSRRSFFKPETRNHFCVKSWMNRNRRVRFTSPPSHLLSTGSRLRKRRTKVDRGPRFTEEPRRLEERLRKKPTVECHFELTPCSSNPFFPAGRETPGFCTTLRVCLFLNEHTRSTNISRKFFPEVSSSIQKKKR